MADPETGSLGKIALVGTGKGRASMLIAQITDIHLGFEPGNPAEFNRKRLDQVLRLLCEGANRPDILLMTGDLTDHGDDDSYRRLVTAISTCPFPVWPCVGNHDDRDAFLKFFPGLSDENGFIQYVVPLESRRIVVIDTMEPGRHGGAFCERRATWLSDQLAKAPDTPTLIVMHHPPFEAGIEWMNTHPDEPWVQRFAQAIAGHAQVQAITCGHLHRSVSASWNGTTVIICSSTAPQVALDFSPMNPDAPDNRTMIVADPPAYALHRWTDHALVTHFDTADDHVMLAKYDASLQGLVRTLLDERP